MKLHENQPLFAQLLNFAANTLEYKTRIYREGLLDYSCITADVSKYQCRESSFQRGDVPI